jgi:hypothetical protein
MTLEEEDRAAANTMLTLEMLHVDAVRTGNPQCAKTLFDLIVALKKGESHPLLDAWVKRTG